ncbi:hypothetical protein [Streptomyces sp. NPDC047043]|uniref:hypothetical protein n=1 Tax=Streptomyces sp. NPDC047043 TaxID=3154497 RepID=UPI0033D2D1D1
MIVRWLMTLGERNRPDAPTFAECPGPHEARAVALVDDVGQLFPVLLKWRRLFGDDLTGWASQVEADDIETLPAEVIESWRPDQLRESVTSNSGSAEPAQPIEGDQPLTLPGTVPFAPRRSAVRWTWSRNASRRFGLAQGASDQDPGQDAGCVEVWTDEVGVCPVRPDVPARAAVAWFVADEHRVVRVGNRLVAVPAEVQGRGHEAALRWQVHPQRRASRMPTACGSGTSCV